MKQEADLLITNAVIYTVDESFSIAEAMAIKDFRILAVGTDREITGRYRSTNVLDLDGKYIYPGWIDPHCHFYGYGLTLADADLAGTTSPEQIIDILIEYEKDSPGNWLTGRGWDQNDWEKKDFPRKEMLDDHFPATPVFLKRIDGHAAWVNSHTLELAGITANTKVSGGEVLLQNGEPSGILLDNAIDLVSGLLPPPSPEKRELALLRAQQNCFSVGLTSVHDAGLAYPTIRQIEKLQQEGNLKMRINAMVDPSAENIKSFVYGGPKRNDQLSIGTIKLYADGALGSRGALLIDPYSDDPRTRGLLLTPERELRRICQIAFEHGFQVATHCIGDSANRLMLNLYGDILGGLNDRRWRIEHAQVIRPEDIPLYAAYGIIPSIQSTHATSDMYWAEDRLGKERMKGAYAYRQLLEQNGWIANGSDFPVEHINPLLGFYAAVSRRDLAGFPESGFLPGEALSREQAMRAMTIWAAKSTFEEQLKGSIEEGKLADFMVTDQDVMKVPEDRITATKVLYTYSGGELVYTLEGNSVIE